MRKLLVWDVFCCPWPGVELPCGGMGSAGCGVSARVGLGPGECRSVEERQCPTGLALVEGLRDGTGAALEWC